MVYASSRSDHSVGHSQCLRDRNAGIDLLRLIAMLSIVCVHYLQHGGLLDSVSIGTSQYVIAQLIFTIVVGGVDTFAVISGYVGLHAQNRPYRWSRYLELWVTAIFYGLLANAVMLLVDSNVVNSSTVIQALTPVASNEYWYLTSYIVVFAFSPMLNLFVTGLGVDKMPTALGTGLVLLYISHLVTGWFSPALLVYLYLVGACLRKLQDDLGIELLNAPLIAVALVFISWTWSIVVPTLSNRFDGGLLQRYDSPTIIVTAMLLVAVFSRLQIKGRMKLILGTIAPSIFSVYLINDQPLLRVNIITGCMTGIASSVLLTGIAPITFAVAFLVIALAIDRLRIVIFESMKVRQFCMVAVKASEDVFSTIMIAICGKHVSVHTGNDEQIASKPPTK